MGNSKNQKASKKRKSSSKSKNSSEHKENVPKNKKNKAIKPNPDDSIAMSKQLLMKKKSVCSQKRSLSKHERICPNGKPIPSLSELEKMFEDSDDDDVDKTPENPTQNPCITPKKQTPASVSKNNLLSPTTINKITERVMGLIEKQNLPDPIELLEVSPLFSENSPPPPVIPPKKRKKPEVPYIVGCKDRPKVISKPNTNFCKGDDDYGVEASGEDQEEQPPTKRAKKSKIPTYSKSIFNAHSDEIAERLTKDDAGGLSDDSSDSNKTIEYDPTQFQNMRPHSFSPLPSTSTDKETFIKNDELFNESLREINVTKESTPKKKKDEEQIIDIPYDTIVIDDDTGKTAEIQNTSNAIDTNVIEMIEPAGLEVVMPKDEIEIQKINEDECIIVPSSTTSNNVNSSNQPIVIDDEYSSINMEFDSYNSEPIEVIDVDDIIAENKSILDKWKVNVGKELNKINTVVDVPTTYKNATTPQTNHCTQSIDKNLSMTNENNETNSQNNQRPQRSVSEVERSSIFQSILEDFFKETQQRQVIPSGYVDGMGRFFDTVVNRLQTPGPTSNSITTLSHPVNTAPYVSANIVQNSNNRQSDLVDLSHSSSNSGTQQTSITIPHSRTTISHSRTTIPQTSTTIPPPSPAPLRNIGDCPICLDPLTSNNGIASTICGHVFCLKCIQAAIKSNGKKCPTCRKALKGAGGGYHQLYL